jgi:hypothetical protein
MGHVGYNVPFLYPLVNDKKQIVNKPLNRRDMSKSTKVFLSEKEMPKQWYNSNESDRTGGKPGKVD